MLRACCPNRGPWLQLNPLPLLLPPEPGSQAGAGAFDALAEALARGAARLGAGGLTRAAAAFAQLAHVPAALLGEAALKAVMRGDGADAGASAVLELLLALAPVATGTGAGGGAGAGAAMPQELANNVSRALLDALGRLSPPTLAAALAAFHQLALGAAGARLLSKLSADLAKRPVAEPGRGLVLAVMRGLAGAVDGMDAAAGGGGSLRHVSGALLTRLWSDLQPELPELTGDELAAAIDLMARLGCLSPSTPWKARAAEALSAEARARLAPRGERLQAALAALPSLQAALAVAEAHPGGRELAAEVQHALDEALAGAPLQVLWACALGMAQAEGGADGRAFAPGGCGSKLLEAVAPRLAGALAPAPGGGSGRRVSGGAEAEGAQQQEQIAELGLAALDLAGLAAIVEAWLRQPASVRDHSAALVTWLDSPAVVAAALGPLHTPAGAGAPEQADQQAPPLQPGPRPLSAASWRLLERLLRGAVSVVEASVEAKQHAAAGTAAEAPDGEGGAAAAVAAAAAALVEAQLPASLVASCLSLIEAQGAPPGNGGAAECGAADAVSLLWSLSVLRVLGLQHWDVLAIALDKPGISFDQVQLAAVFEAHALVLLRLHGVAPLPTPAGKLQECRDAYWARRLAASAPARAALSGALERAGALPRGAGVTAQEHGHLLLVDCIDHGEPSRGDWSRNF